MCGVLTFQKRSINLILSTLFAKKPSIAAVLKNLLKYAGVNAVLSGIRPCIVAMIIATAISMGLNTLLGFADYTSSIVPDLRSIIIFMILFAVSFLLKKIWKKKLSPILMIVLSAVLGIVFWGF